MPYVHKKLLIVVQNTFVERRILGISGVLCHRTHIHGEKVFPLLSPTTRLTEVVKQSRLEVMNTKQSLRKIVVFFVVVVDWFDLVLLASSPVIYRR